MGRSFGIGQEVVEESSTGESWCFKQRITTQTDKHENTVTQFQCENECGGQHCQGFIFFSIHCILVVLCPPPPPPRSSMPPHLSQLQPSPLKKQISKQNKKLTHKVKPKYTTKDQEDRKYSKKQFKTKIPSSSLYVGYRA